MRECFSFAQCRRCSVHRRVVTRNTSPTPKARSREIGGMERLVSALRSPEQYVKQHMSSLKPMSVSIQEVGFLL